MENDDLWCEKHQTRKHCTLCRAEQSGLARYKLFRTFHHAHPEIWRRVRNAYIDEVLGSQDFSPNKLVAVSSDGILSGVRKSPEVAALELQYSHLRGGDKAAFKLNQNYVALYSRLVMAKFPAQLAGRVNTKSLQSPEPIDILENDYWDDDQDILDEDSTLRLDTEWGARLARCRPLPARHKK